MGNDSLSPFGPVRINALLVPAGRVKRSKFSSFVARLQDEHVVRLGDGRPQANGDAMTDMFSPLAFPDGRVLYHFTTSESPRLSVESFPFELNREVQAVLYLADGSAMTLSDRQRKLQEDSPEDRLGKTRGAVDGSWTIDSLRDELETSRPRYRRAIIHLLVVFDLTLTAESNAMPSDVLYVPPLERSRITTMKTTMCDITARLLLSMDDLAHEIQDLPTIDSPTLATSSKYASTDIAARVHARMSMPGKPSVPFDSAGVRNSAGIISIARSTTPAGGRSGSRRSLVSPSRADRLSDVSDSRDVSRDRSSMMSSTVNTPTERKKNRSFARCRIVIGALYLQAGLWPDAIKDLSDGTAAARNNNDHIWHAKGLEYIIACLLMFGWAEMYFQIPHICYPIAEKPSLPKSSSATPSSSNAELAPYGRSSDSRTVSLHYLTKLLPELLGSINTLYTRASTSTQEASLPQLLVSESILRCGYLLAAMFLRNGIIDDEMLRAITSSTSIPRAGPTARPTETVSLKKSEVTTMLIQSIPAFAGNLPLNELLQMLIGLASILSMIGMERKQAFVLKELLQKITPGLVEARKVGAAEMGVHPAAGLLALSNATNSGSLRIEEGMKSLLEFVGTMYAALEPEGRQTPSSRGSTERPGSLAAGRLQLHAYGSFDLKVDILKSCMAVCEVLPDFEGVLKYAVQLLHLSRRVLTLPFHESCEKPAISQDEQTRLMTSIQRTVGAASKLGVQDILADYWDDFLVRGIEPTDPAVALRLTAHSPKELQSINETAKGSRKDPFIYNPFSKSTPSATDQPLVAGELTYFSVYLQNPFEIDVEIDEISLLTKGCDFQPSRHSIVLGHLCCQRFTLAGTSMASGTLNIVGCRAKIRYCKEQDFGIYPKDWKLKLGSKTKISSTKIRNKLLDSAPSTASETTESLGEPSNAGPESEIVSLAVLSAQPFFSVQSTSLSQPALMVLEGERKSFKIVLRNESKSNPADAIFFTFQDSATTQLRAALTNKNLSPTELYELQFQLAGRTPFQYITNGGKGTSSIPAGETATFVIEVLGIPGLLNGVVQVDYAQLGLPLADVKNKFYTRQISVPLAVTVNAGIEVPRCNMLPFSGDFAWWNRKQALGSSRQDVEVSNGGLEPGLRLRSASSTPTHTDGGQFASLLARLGLGSHGDDHCLLLLDLRNVWPFPLSVSVQVREMPGGSASPVDLWRRAYTVHETLQPGQISRAVLLIPRLYVSDPHAPIPLIGNQRQFVVSASKVSVEAERANREAFWYREELLKHIRGSWQEESTGREGAIDLRRGIRLGARMIDALRIEDIEIGLAIDTSAPGRSEQPLAMQDGRSRFIFETNSFATLIVKIHNRSSRWMHLLLRLQPSLHSQPHSIALDLSKRFAWTGMLQRALHPPVAPAEIRQARLGLTALCAGEYEIGATVEELKSSLRGPDGMQAGAHSRSNERMVWHAREQCLINAVDHIKP